MAIHIFTDGGNFHAIYGQNISIEKSSALQPIQVNFSAESKNIPAKAPYGRMFFTIATPQTCHEAKEMIGWIALNSTNGKKRKIREEVQRRTNKLVLIRLNDELIARRKTPYWRYLFFVLWLYVKWQLLALVQFLLMIREIWWNSW